MSTSSRAVNDWISSILSETPSVVNIDEENLPSTIRESGFFLQNGTDFAELNTIPAEFTEYFNSYRK